MKPITRIFIALAALLCPAMLRAQCNLTYTLNYTAYNSYSTDANGVIYTGVTTDGSASMGINAGPYCPPSAQQQMQNQINNARHTPAAKNVLVNITGSFTVNQGGQYTGTQSCVTCYLSYTNEEDVSGVPVGEVIKESTGGVVLCTVGGTIFSSLFDDFDMELALTFSKNVGGSPWAWALQNYCTASTTPPDYQPPYAYLQGYYPFYMGEAICVSATVLPPGWHCSPGADLGNSEINPPPFACTKNPPVH